MGSCFQVRTCAKCVSSIIVVIFELLETPPSCGLRVFWLACWLLLLGIISTSKVFGKANCFSLTGLAQQQSFRTRTFLGASPVFSVMLGLLVYGAALTIYNSLIRPGRGDPVLAVGVPVYIIWLSTTVRRNILM